MLEALRAGSLAVPKDILKIDTNLKGMEEKDNEARAPSKKKREDNGNATIKASKEER